MQPDTARCAGRASRPALAALVGQRATENSPAQGPASTYLGPLDRLLPGSTIGFDHPTIPLEPAPGAFAGHSASVDLIVPDALTPTVIDE